MADLPAAPGIVFCAVRITPTPIYLPGRPVNLLISSLPYPIPPRLTSRFLAANTNTPFVSCLDNILITEVPPISRPDQPCSPSLSPPLLPTVSFSDHVTNRSSFLRPGDLFVSHSGAPLSLSGGATGVVRRTRCAAGDIGASISARLTPHLRQKWTGSGTEAILDVGSV